MNDKNNLASDDKKFKEELVGIDHIVKRQHFLSKFLIKNWSKGSNSYTLFEPSSKIVEKVIFNSAEDIYFEDFFYEQKNLQINEIENYLSEIESAFAKIVKKVTNLKYDKEKINFTGKEMITTFCWTYIQNIRTKNWREAQIKGWKEVLGKEINDEEAYIKFYREINSNIARIYKEIFLTSKNLNSMKKLLNFSDYLNWVNEYSTAMLNSFNNVLNNIDNIADFSTHWVAYEFQKYGLHKDAKYDMYWFFHFFTPVVIKTSLEKPFILSDQIFENSFLNNTFQVHTIPISPEYAITFISRDMDYNVATIWPDNFINYRKKYFSANKISQQFESFSKTNNINFNVPIIKINEEQVIKINNSLFWNSQSQSVIISNDWVKNIFKEDYYYESSKITFDFEGRYLLYNKNGTLKEKEQEEYFRRIRKGWFIRKSKNDLNFFDDMLNRIRLTMVVYYYDGSKKIIHFGERNNNWYYSEELVENFLKKEKYKLPNWYKYQINYFYNDLRDAIFSLVHIMKIPFVEIKRIIVEDSFELDEKMTGYMYMFHYDFIKNDFYLEKLSMKISQIKSRVTLENDLLKKWLQLSTK